MKKLVLVFALTITFISFAFAWDDLYNIRPYKDYWGNSYKYYENLWKDSDRDGVINYFDYNDRNPNIQTPYQYKYYLPKSLYRNYYGW